LFPLGFKNSKFFVKGGQIKNFFGNLKNGQLRGPQKN